MFCGLGIGVGIVLLVGVMLEGLSASRRLDVFHLLSVLCESEGFCSCVILKLLVLLFCDCAARIPWCFLNWVNMDIHQQLTGPG